MLWFIFLIETTLTYETPSDLFPDLFCRAEAFPEPTENIVFGLIAGSFLGVKVDIIYFQGRNHRS